MDTRNNDSGTKSIVTTAALGTVSALYVMTVAIFIIVRMRAKRGSSHNLPTEETSGPAYDLVIEDRVQLFFFIIV